MPRLTPEQRAFRLTGVGASESAAIVGLDPYRGPVDVWMRKPVGGRRPLVVEEDREENDAAELGHALEGGIREFYRRRTGIEVEPCEHTLRHPEIHCVLASPDGLAVHEDSGLEVKLVGARMAHHWAEDRIPDYVLCQVVQNMAVTGRARWDVIALIGGTVPRIFTIERDLDLEADLLAAVQAFWEANVLADVVPEAQSSEERRRYLLQRYPGSEKTKCREDNDPHVADMVRSRAIAAAGIEQFQTAYDAYTDFLCGRVGNAYGIEGDWGKFLWYRQQGRVDWQAVAEEICGGAVPISMIERHRGEPTRVPRFYPPTERSEARRRKSKRLNDGRASR